MGILFSILTAILFALSNIYSSKASKSFSGLQAIVLTVTLNLFMLLPLALAAKLINQAPWPNLVTILLFLLVGAVGTFLGRWGLYNSIALIGPSRASVIKNSAPVFSIIMAFLIFSQLPTLLSFIGILCILFGIWVTGWEKKAERKESGEGEGESKSSNKWLRGIALGIIVAFLFSLADILRTVSIPMYSDTLVAAGFAALGAWLSMVIFIVFKKDTALLRVISKESLKWKSIDKNLFVAAICAGIAQITNFIAVKSLFVPYVSALVATAPLWTAALSHLLMKGDESFGATFWKSLVLILGGCILIVIFK